MLTIGSYVWILGPQLVVLLGHVGMVKCCWATCMCILMFYSPVSLPVYFLPPYSRYNIIICPWFCLHVFPVWWNASPWNQDELILSSVASYHGLCHNNKERNWQRHWLSLENMFSLWGFCFHLSCCAYIISRSGKGKDELIHPFCYDNSCQYLLE